MFEEDQETLAAEYVLGTLSAEEREHAEALRSFDPEFDAAVRQWERRLGELNVMVEAVEPPAEVWDKIKKEVSPEAAAAADAASSETAAEAEGPRDLDSPGTTDVVAGDFLFLEPSTQPAEVSEEPAEASEKPAETPADDLAVPPPLAARQGGVPRSADIVVLRRRVRRWRGFTIGLGAIAALLAAYIAVSQVAPDLDSAATAGGRRRPDGAHRTAGARAAGPAGCRIAAAADSAGLPAHGGYPAAHAVRAPSFRRA